MKHTLMVVTVLALGLGACADTPTAPDQSQLPPFTLNTQNGEEQGTTSAVFPSTNVINAGLGWAHVEFVDIDVGAVTLNFVQPRAFAACFEYRVDGAAAPAGSVNYNTAVTDGLYAFYCLNNSSATHTIPAGQYVDIRMAFGAEGDERFTWTRFYAPTSQESKDLCKEGAWEANGFANLGQCVRFAETGKL
jgi:hypothetical protein